MLGKAVTELAGIGTEASEKLIELGFDKAGYSFRIFPTLQ
jgi:hypothetical protein